MSEIEGYACDRNGMLMPTRCCGSNGDECMCWPKIAQTTEAEGVGIKKFEFEIGEGGPVTEPLVRYKDHLAALSAVTAERDRLLSDNEALLRGLRGKHELTGATYEYVIAERDQLRAEVEALRKDASRLDRLDIECEAYGCEGIHEGNRWMIDGPFRTVRDAIDADLSAQGGDA